MKTEYSSTANSITEILLAGDAILNLTQQPLNTIAGTCFVSASGEDLFCRKSPAFITWKYGFTYWLSRLVGGEVSRLVVISEENCGDAQFIVRELVAKCVPHIHCTLVNPCDADDFMDEQDAEAVSERLKQLGYI